MVDDARVYHERAVASFELGRWSAAITDFDKARQLNRDEPASWIGLATALLMDSRVYEAIDIYEGLLAVKPRLVIAHIQLALIYYRLGVITKGHRQLDLALSCGPSLEERKRITDLKNEQLLLDKKRHYKPDFQALHEKNG